jgi:hypothetical protein
MDDKGFDIQRKEITFLCLFVSFFLILASLYLLTVGVGGKCRT